MRIRKQATKLLGWAPATVPFPSSSCPPSPAAHSWQQAPIPLPESSPREAAAGGLRCQLNLSPWDAMESHFCTDSQDEAEETIVFENGFEDKEEQITSSGSAAAAAAAKEEDAGGKKEKATAAKKSEKTAINGASGHETSAITMKCKKTDGKGWRCKRPADLPHSLCRYHLAQLRSYNRREAFSEDSGRHGRKKKPLAAVPEISERFAASNYYYYYSAFGPWKSKRRGTVGEINGAGGVHDRRESSESADNSTVMADDDDDIDDEDEEEEEEEVDGGKTNKSKQERAEGKKKKEMLLKRKGRKPVKARSLKSLL